MYYCSYACGALRQIYMYARAAENKRLESAHPRDADPSPLALDRSARPRKPPTQWHRARRIVLPGYCHGFIELGLGFRGSTPILLSRLFMNNLQEHPGLFNA